MRSWVEKLFGPWAPDHGRTPDMGAPDEPGKAPPKAAPSAPPVVAPAAQDDGGYDGAKFRAALKHHEGLALRLYTDTVGKRSIGIGRNLDDVGISEDEAWYLAENDIRRSERDLDRYLPWWRGLDDVRQRVVLDMCFNMGIGNAERGLRSFANTLEAIRAGRYDDAARGMLASKWAVQVKGRAKTLAEMMRTGRDA